MYRLKLFQYLLVILIFSISNQIISKELDKEKYPYFYIGVENKKNPYSYLDENKEPKGILITKIKSLCTDIQINCLFIMSGDIGDLFSKLRTGDISAVLIQDSFILPEIEEIILSTPICKIKPIFIQKKTATIKNKPEDFKGKIVGVQRASLLHIYLLDHYNNFSKLKPYVQLENAIFDLTTRRIDAFLADEAFFKQRVLTTSLGNDGNPLQLIALEVKSIKITNPTMSIAFRKRDKKGLYKFNNLLNQSKIDLCSELIDK